MGGELSGRDYAGILKQLDPSQCKCGILGSDDLHEAAEKGCYVCCSKHIEQAKTISYDRTATMLAATKGHADIVQLLIQKEAGMRNSEGKTALMFAIEQKHFNIACALMPYEKRILDKDGRSACCYAAQAENEKFLETLLLETDPANGPQYQLAKQSDCTCYGDSHSLEQAVTIGCPRCCVSFIHEVASFQNGQTPLIMAVQKNHLGIVRLLVPFGGYMPGLNSRTALMHAAMGGHLEIMQFLAPFQACVKDDTGRTALMLAVQQGYTNAVRLLTPLEAGVVGPDGKSALDLAMENYNKECFEILRQSRAEMRIAQIPPIMMAAFNGDLASLRAHQADWMVMNGSLTALDFALLGRQRRAAEALTGSEVMRSFFRSAMLAAGRKLGPALAQLVSVSGGPSLARLVMCTLYSQEDIDGSLARLCGAIVRHRRNAFQTFHAFCVPDAITMENALSSHRLMGIYVNISLASGQIALKTSLQLKAMENPLWRHQVKAASRKTRSKGRKGAADHAKSLARLETKFNLRALVEARHVARKTQIFLRKLHVPSGKRLAEKTEQSLALFAGGYRFLYARVEEMLAE